MNEKSRGVRIKRALFSVRRYLIFFISMSFIVTCCMLLFLNILESAMGIEYTEEQIGQAAKLTFANVILLSAVCTVVDGIQRKFTVQRPVKRIVSAADKIIKGDFSARIQPLHNTDSPDGFDIIIDYFNKIAEELSGTETLRTDFIANVSHEIKTPLAVMQNYGTMLQQPDLSEEKRIEYAKAITDTSRRLADLISNILKLNKLENQQIFPSKQAYDLGEQLCECLLSFENVWENKSIEIKTDIEERVFIESDMELLSLVWNNLFSNAFKFTDIGGTVTLTLKAEGDFAIVQVGDNGCGISQEVGKHIFEKFYQGDASHSTQGNGLGLALVKRVMDITSGDISVSSEVGKGSIFTVKLKRKTDE